MRNDPVILEAKIFAEANGYPKEVFPAFQNQYKGAVKRGIAWEFTIKEWWEWWQTDDRWANRGSRRDSLVMARFNDLGSYHPKNTYCPTFSQNGKDRKGNPKVKAAAIARWDKKREGGYIGFKQRIVITLSPIQHSWLKQQADSFGISVSEMLRRIIDELRKPKN